MDRRVIAIVFVLIVQMLVLPDIEAAKPSKRGPKKPRGTTPTLTTSGTTTRPNTEATTNGIVVVEGKIMHYII